MIRTQPARPLVYATKQILIAIAIDATVPKEKVLHAYAHHVYLGHVRERRIEGFSQAAKTYYDTTPENLTVAQIAALVAAIRSPHGYGPMSQSEIAVNRRLIVLDLLARAGVITEDERREGRLMTIRVASSH